MNWRGFQTIFCCCACGLGLGLLVGILMGKLAPDFGLAIFGGNSPDHPPLLSGQQICIGLGIANGVWVGLLAGLGLVIAEAIKSRKTP